MSKRVLESKKKLKGASENGKKLFFSKTANPMFYLKSNMALVDLRGTFCTGICLGPSLLIFWFTRRGVNI